MSTTTCTTAVGVFATRTQADKAIDALCEAGFNASQIGVAVRNRPNPIVHDDAEAGDHVKEGAATGAIAGIGVGGLVGVGVLSGIIPVVGPALLGGTLGVIASNAAAGAAVATVLGALVGWGVPEDDAQYYEAEVAAGRAVVTVNAEERCDEARVILKLMGATSRDPSIDSSKTT